LSGRLRSDGRLRHRVRGRHQDRAIRGRGSVLRDDDRAGTRVGADVTVLAPRRSDHQRVEGRSRRRQTRFRRDAGRDLGLDRRRQVAIAWASGLRGNGRVLRLADEDRCAAPPLGGEGLIGLTRGFLYAGAPTVVASLWDVSDRSTAELMTRFYRAMLQEGL